ncbi:MAG: FG-GAP repeat domain-containing protein [Planctomycetota bacterium]|jgi:hypothetical protein
MRSLLACLLLGSWLQAQGDIAEVNTIILAKGMEVAEVWYLDLSDDGIEDLVLAVVKEDQSFARSLRIHLARGEEAKAAFVQEPDAIIELPASVSACGFGDVHSDPGREVIWFGARGAYAFRRTAEPAEAVVKIVASEYLFQFPQSDGVRSWQEGVRDLNGDGLVDLILPEPQGFRVAIQQRDQAGERRFVSSSLSLPEKLPARDARGATRAGRRGRRPEIGMEFSSVRKRRPPLVSVTETLPAPQILDWDADGDLDLIAKREQRVLVWLQSEAGSFAADPALDLAFPLTASQTELDPSYGAWMSDFDGDQRADALLIAKDRDADDLRSQILFFRQDPESEAPLFNGGRPQQLLLLAGLALPPELIDVDGNGFVDLQVGSWRLDMLDQLTAGENRSLEGEIYLYLNEAGRFSRRPDLTYPVSLKGEEISSGDSLLFEFFADINGDGIRDLLLRKSPEEVELQLLRRRNGRLSVLERSVWQMRVDKEARIEVLPLSSQRPGFLVRESDRVLLVRF